MQINKVVRDGKVAVLYSPGFGAGWSTWRFYSDDGVQQFLLHDAKLVELAENKADESTVRAYLQEVFGEDAPYTGGWSDIEVAWLAEGTRFEITEYDGSEDVRVFHDLPGYTA